MVHIGYYNWLSWFGLLWFIFHLKSLFSAFICWPIDSNTKSRQVLSPHGPCQELVWFILVHNGSYWFILVHIGYFNWFILVHTCSHLFMLVILTGYPPARKYRACTSVLMNIFHHIWADEHFQFRGAIYSNNCADEYVPIVVQTSALMIIFNVVQAFALMNIFHLGEERRNVFSPSSALLIPNYIALSGTQLRF